MLVIQIRVWIVEVRTVLPMSSVCSIYLVLAFIDVLDSVEEEPICDKPLLFALDQLSSVGSKALPPTLSIPIFRFFLAPKARQVICIHCLIERPLHSECERAHLLQILN